MHAVIFEVQPTPEGIDEYLEIAGTLRSELEKINGFISVERFQSMTTEGKLLSLSFWESEIAILEWRKQIKHQNAQSKGYNELFADYRIRVAEVIRDYTMTDRDQAPQSTPATDP